MHITEWVQTYWQWLAVIAFVTWAILNKLSRIASILTEILGIVYDATADKREHLRNIRNLR